MAMQVLAFLAAVVVVGGPGYDEADKRATAHDANAIGTAYDTRVMYPVITQANALKLCADTLRIKLGADTPRFTIVVSFKDYEYATAFLDKETPLSRCVAERFAKMPLPRAPIADYAERLLFRFQ